eukprot:12891153-Prorocentrum_lima.AAC.1
MTRVDPDPTEQQTGLNTVKSPGNQPQWIAADALQAAFPTDSRMRQKAKEAVIKLETGKKHVPKSKPKYIEVGDDDCGEDFTSIAWVDA